MDPGWEWLPDVYKLSIANGILVCQLHAWKHVLKNMVHKVRPRLVDNVNTLVWAIGNHFGNNSLPLDVCGLPLKLKNGFEEYCTGF